ncbi:hypothetical protein WMF04_01875 [Sorangium sp. So ce260]|uniref:hypothetical protein n=1 Tax=Sorangium sp. So ce260 TaxID=3133291 RepID=UPI003F61340F
MRRATQSSTVFLATGLACALLGAGACGPDGAPGAPATPVVEEDAGAPEPPDAGVHRPVEETKDPLARCQDSDAAFVRRAHLAALGRRPRSQDEVRFYTDLIRQVDGGAPLAEGAPLSAGRRHAVLAMIKTSQRDYLRRWTDFYLDSLRVVRASESSVQCFSTLLSADRRKAAERVRREPARAQGDEFSMLDLMIGSLEGDDVSSIYIANLFSIVSQSFQGANADPVKLELARRQNFGARFSGAYLHRDIVCLRCHNSEASVTFDPEPSKNRFFPMPGLLEKSLFSDSSGPPEKDGHDGIARAYGVFRFGGFSLASTADYEPLPVVLPNTVVRPWGWTAACGEFFSEIGDDPAGVDALLGSVRGARTSMWDLSAALQRGFVGLRQHGLTRGERGEVPNPDEALAYLVSAHIAEEVWREVIGTPLTVAHYYPRSAATRGELLRATEAFLASGFSHVSLLLEVLRSPGFNLQAPEEGCAGEPYAFAPLFDPWIIAEEDPARRRNSVGDAIAPLSGRTLLSAAHTALDWPAPIAVPIADMEFLGEIGVFVDDGRPGYRGLDFQARLAWENRFATCDIAPEGDFVARLLEAASEQPDATVADLIAALKDRIIGEPGLGDAGEREALEQVLGASLDTAVSALDPEEIERRVRGVCGVLLESPQFMLGTLVPRGIEATPRLTPPDAAYDAVCERLAAEPPIDGLQVECGPGGVRLRRE